MLHFKYVFGLSAALNTMFISLTFTAVTPSPIVSTTPATSVPGVYGRVGLRAYVPARM